MAALPYEERKCTSCCHTLRVATLWKEKRTNKMMVRSWTDWNPIREQLETSCLKE
jgi:hypothetical protein